MTNVIMPSRKMYHTSQHGNMLALPPSSPVGTHADRTEPLAVLHRNRPRPTASSLGHGALPPDSLSGLPLTNTVVCCRWLWKAKKQSASVTVPAAPHPNNIPRSASDLGQAQNPNPNPNIPPQIGAPQQRLSRSADLKRRSLVTVLVVAFYYYPTMVTDALSFFACYNVDPSSHGDNGLYAAKAKVWCS